MGCQCCNFPSSLALEQILVGSNSRDGCFDLYRDGLCLGEKMALRDPAAVRTPHSRVWRLRLAPMRSPGS